MGKEDSNPLRNSQAAESERAGAQGLFRRPWLWTAGGALIGAAILGFVLVRATRDVPATRPSTQRPVDAPEAPDARKARPRADDFVGAEACARCHQKEYDLWRSSTHGQAGGEPGEVKIIARFDGRPLRFKDGVVTPTLNGQGTPLFIVEQEGLPKMEILVRAAIGGGHMLGGGTQSFFYEFPDGTLRFLPFDFIRRENLWFVQLRQDMTWAPVSNDISLQADLANWPPHRVLGTLTEFSNCQNCHGSQITLRYDETLRRYETRYQSLRINCESCHGPGRRHIDIVTRPGFENLTDIGMKPLAALSKEDSLIICFQCHAKKDALREDAYLPGAQLEEYFSLKLCFLGDSPFRADGRVQSFDYQSNHQFSDCYVNGSMTCVDCHDPHAQGYRDVFGAPLAGKFDNRQCTSCHASRALAPERHSHHPAGSPGNLCTSCHMPFLQHQGVGTRLGYARSDHTIPIPRPAFDQQLGLENACQKCHQDKDISWQEAKVKEWYGAIKPHPKLIADSLRAADTTDPVAAARLLLAPSAKHPMAQAAALAAYLKRFLLPNQPALEPVVVENLRAFARSDDLDLQALALMGLQVGYDQHPEVRAFLDERVKSLGEHEEAVRGRWGIAADHLGNAYAARGDLPNAVLCFQKSLEAKPDNFVTMSHLALAYLKSGDLPSGLGWLRKAIQVQPHKAVLHFQLAQTYAQLQQIPEARQALEEGLRYAPEDQKAKRMLEQLRAVQ